jgi:Asp-tRNA(Asn)/Glu-tRNA(Gln) amidotransferase A subunit family amidase
MLPANPTQDTMGPMTRTVSDAARLLDVMAGYDPNDPITAYAVGSMPATYTTALVPTALRGVRIGVLRVRRDSLPPRPAAPTTRRDSTQTDSAWRADSTARLVALARRDSMEAENRAEFAKVRPVFDGSLTDLRAQGAIVIDSLSVPVIPGPRVSNSFETEEATDAYFAQHPNAPVKTLREILLSGKVNPWRARSLADYLGKTTNDPGYLQVLKYRESLRVAVLKMMADRQLDVLVYATYDAPPAVIAADVLTNPRPNDGYGRGDNRGLSPETGWPALTVPAGFSSDGLPVGLEFLGRPFTESRLLGYGFAYEQATRHRRPPTPTPPLR